MQIRERKKAMKDDKYKIKPNPLLDPKILVNTLILFVKEQCKSNFTFHLPASSKKWIKFK
jgi:hypothetical protein